MTPRSLCYLALLSTAACGSGRLAPAPADTPEPASPGPVAAPAPAAEPTPATTPPPSAAPEPDRPAARGRARSGRRGALRAL